MEKIKEKIKNNLLESAANELYELIANTAIIKSIQYSECFFYLGFVHFKRFQETEEADLINKAIMFFEHADNVYKSLSRKRNSKYTEAIIYAKRYFSSCKLRT